MMKQHHRIAVTAALVYLVAVGLVVFWPTPVDRPAAGTLQAAISWFHLHGMPKFIAYGAVEFSANIVMFIPMGFIASLFLRNGWLAVIAGTLASCLIELSQAVLLPARFASGMDILANSLGAGIGIALYYLGQSRRRRTPSEPESEIDPAPGAEAPHTLMFVSSLE